jgi:hypothetical protein
MQVSVREVTLAPQDFGEFFSREYSRLAPACLLLTGIKASIDSA